MSNPILETEHILNTLLPPARLTEKPSAGLLKASRNWSAAIWQQAVSLGPMPLNPGQVKQGIALAGNAIFICGVHRSGTTLLRDMLDGHPELVVLPSEGTWYTNLETKLQKLPEYDRIAFLGEEWLRRLVNPINQPPYWLLGRSTSHHSLYVDFARYFMAWWPVVNHQTVKHWPHTVVMLAYASVTNKLDAEYWVDKSPTNEQFLDRLWHDVPKAKIIHIIRNPHAVVSSRKKMEPTISLRRIIKDLGKSYTIANKQTLLNDAQFMLIRYEDLCEDTTLFIEKLTAFLGIKSDPTLLSPTVAGHPVQANSSFITNAIAGQIIPQAQYKHPDVLTNHEKEILQAYLKLLAKRMGYELSGINYFKSIYIKLRYLFARKLSR